MHVSVLWLFVRQAQGVSCCGASGRLGKHAVVFASSSTVYVHTN